MRLFVPGTFFPLPDFSQNFQSLCCSFFLSINSGNLLANVSSGPLTLAENFESGVMIYLRWTTNIPKRAKEEAIPA